MSTSSEKAFWRYLDDLHSQMLKGKCLHAEDNLLLKDIEFSGPTANAWFDIYPDVIDSEKPVRKNWSPYK
jgi:hypothetical protein